MARYTGPKNKRARAIGEDLGLKSNPLKVSRRLAIRPGMHGAKRRRKLSDYGKQLKEKQKAKYMYGVLEKALRSLYEEASKDPTATGETLLRLLELRLDNVIYRAGLAPTRASARQIVAHGHVVVNDGKMNIPSYRVELGDVVTLKRSAATIPAVAGLLEAEPDVPAWMKKKATVVTVSALPTRTDIAEAIDEQLIVEYYSR
ncbi:MAG: 30S ribosomal protein S4 [Pseudomonadales bacterium]|nr:30S ribosomal protein S4 [Candidatus Woesebacteria bacterium]MCB9801731.1 30S ribosomal protein S4 [Pseudomonadales bacterium]